MDRNPHLTPQRIASYAVIAVLVIAVIVLGLQVLAANRELQWARSLTPTPQPGWRNVMQVTIDPSAPTPAPTIRNGSSGETVWKLQERLQALGYYTGSLDGQFGAGTQEAVIRFQEQHGLEADGIVGTQTSELLYSDRAQKVVVTPTPTPQAITVGSTGDSVRDLQQRLSDLGYYQGNVDGISGPATQAAVKYFQQQHGLDADGIAGPATCAVLYSDQAQKAVVTPTPSPAPVSDQAPGTLKSGAPMLVNADNHLPDGYRTSELVRMRDYCDSRIVTIKGSDIQGEKIAVDALMTMLRAAHADGLTVWQISAGYRSIEYQTQLFNDRVYALRQDGYSGAQARAEVRKTVADPGASEHHLGLAFDVTVPGEQFSNTKQSLWLAQHCWEYGFILRYPSIRSASPASPLSPGTSATSAPPIPSPCGTKTCAWRNTSTSTGTDLPSLHPHI